MIIGYSCWGFLGCGVLDTPDGGRSHRLVLLNGLVAAGFDIVMLQKNRDLLEANQDFSGQHLSFDDGFPDIDVLFVEYRWKITGRNCDVPTNSANYTPDLDRQNELLRYYERKNIPILIWDKDQKLLKKDLSNRITSIFEPALKPRRGRKRLLFPVDREKNKWSLSRLNNYSWRSRNIELVYIGNQYERDDSFKKFIDTPSELINIKASVYGNWNKYPDTYKLNLTKFPHINFKGRVAFSGVQGIYEESLCTVLIAPDNYYKSGQFTQRLFESLWGFCIPVCPGCYYGASRLFDHRLIANNSFDVVKIIKSLQRMSDGEIRDIIKSQIRLLDIFDVDKQVEVIKNEINLFYQELAASHG